MKQFLNFLLLLLPMFGCANIYAQKPASPSGKQAPPLAGQALIDSLLKELPKQKEDTNKVKLLNGLSFNYYYFKPDEGIKYGQQGLELATKLDWKKGIATANKNLGLSYLFKANNDKAMEHTRLALKMYEDMDDKDGIARATGNLGLVYESMHDDSEALEHYFKAIKIDEEIGDKESVARISKSVAINYQKQGDYQRALEYFLKGKKISEEIGYKKNIAGFYGSIGYLYSLQSNNPKSLEYYFKSLEIFEEMGDKNGISGIFINIGWVYENISDYPKAFDYYQKALKIAEEMQDKTKIAALTCNIGNVYMQSDYPKALEYYFKALKLDEEIGNKKYLANVTCNIGLVYIRQKNYTNGIEFAQKALKIYDEIGDKYGMANQLGNIGADFVSLVKYTIVAEGAGVLNEIPQVKYKSNGDIPKDKNGRLNKGIDYLQRGLAMGKEIKALDAMQLCYENLSEAYKLKGDYKRAMGYADDYRVLKDSIFSKQNADKIVKMENTRKQYGDSLKAVDAQRVADIKAQHRRNYEFIGAGVIVLLLGFTFMLTRNNKLLDKEKKQSENLLLNILPEEVASQLKKTGASEAKQFDDVTVLFTDFVNFTSASERMKPQELLEELNTCFRRFDEITFKYGIEKIKTIGDAYLAVGGLPKADPKHAENAVNAAKEINAFMDDRLAKLGRERTFEIRIGVHSGSVVAGIVGIKKFAYDIWGDTVNTAARMEQNSEPGKINISQTTYELVKDKINCTYRGEIDAKGKGQLKMYYVG